MIYSHDYRFISGSLSLAPKTDEQCACAKTVALISRELNSSPQWWRCDKERRDKLDCLKTHVRAKPYTQKHQYLRFIQLINVDVSSVAIIEVMVPFTFNLLLFSPDMKTFLHASNIFSLQLNRLRILKSYFKIQSVLCWLHFSGLHCRSQLNCKVLLIHYEIVNSACDLPESARFFVTICPCASKETGL